MSNAEKQIIPLKDLKEVIPTPHLNLPDIEELHCYTPKDGTPYMIFDCKAVQKFRGYCPSCGSPLIYIKGYQNEPRKVHDVAVGVTRIDLLIQTPRYECQQCGQTFTHKFESIVESRHMTERLYEQIKKETFTRPFNDIAAEFGYADKTIAEIFDDYAEELEKERGPIVAPRVLGIDENHIHNSMRGVFVDIESGTLLEITEDNKKNTVIKTIQGMKDYKKNIKIITMDFSCGYRAYVHKILPEANIIVDHYHVIQDLHRKVTTTKGYILEKLALDIDNMYDSPQKTEMRKKLTMASGDTYLFRYGMDRIAESPDRLSRLAEVCKTFPEFKHLLRLKEEFELIYQCSDRDTAEAAYNEWKKLVPPNGSYDANLWEEEYGVDPELYREFSALVKTIKSWWEEVFTFFECGYRFTNATTEGLNNLIDHINTAGYGYSFKRLRAKVLFRDYASPKIEYVLENMSKPIYKQMPLTHGYRTGTSFMMPWAHDEKEIVGYEDVVELCAYELPPYEYNIGPLSLIGYTAENGIKF